MRKPILLSLTFLLGCVYANARHISPSEALGFAADFMNSAELRTVGAKTLTAMKAPGVKADAQSSPYYVFNRGEGEGFVIISGDDRAPKILGYSDKGTFDAENLPPQLKAMMEQWAKQMESLPEAAGQHVSWTKSPATRAEEGVLMETAEWGQGYPFNAYAPVIEGEQAPAGCVATAMAIAMKYHNWPDSTRGGEEYDYYHPELTFDFNSYSIDWEVLSNPQNPAFAEQAAKLMYSAGIASQMMYGPSESSAESWAIDHSFIYFYAYSKDCQFLPRYKFVESEWTDILRKQLEEVGPVVYSGFGTGGHTFVVDGYDNEGLYHVNWGWDGMLNGYYTLEFSLENGMSFGEGHGMVINLTPDKTKTKYSKAWITNADAYGTAENDDWNFLRPNIEEGVPTTFKSPDICISNFRGYVRLAVADAEDRIVSWVDKSDHVKDGYRYYCARPGGYILMENAILPPLQEGQRYQLYGQEVGNGPTGNDNDYQPSQPSDNPDDWQMVVGGMIKPSCFYAEENPSRVTETKVHIAEDLPSYCGNFNSYDKEFTISRLRGLDCPLTMHFPTKGVKMEARSTDKDGTEHDVLYVDWGSDDDPTFVGYNFSMLADHFDITFRYEGDGDTRRDKDLSADQILESDGLIYKIDGDYLVLIGYDKVGEIVTIPNTITVGSQEMPVRYVADEALAHAPIKHLVIEAEILEMGRFSFSGMTKLEGVIIKNLGMESNHYKRFGFIDSGLKTVYFDAAPRDPGIFYYTTGALCEFTYPADILSAAIGVKDIDYVVSEVPKNGYDWEFISGLQYFKDMLPIEDKKSIFNSYMVPGLGNTELLSFIREFPFNICQMWDYEIDKNNQIVRISDLAPNVQIESIEINGEESIEGEDGVFVCRPNGSTNSDISVGIEVVVNYSVNGMKKSTNYSKEYNETVVSTDISEVGSVTGVSDGVSCIYTLDGVLVSESMDDSALRSLTPGIYIVHRGGEMKKLVIR